MTPSHKVINQFDIPEMLNVYAAHPNYEIIDFNNGDNRCFVFFSSHGLYYPNTEAEFLRTVIARNRFEWRQHLPRFAGRAVLVRDVTKQWYLEGINGTINTIDKLAGFLTERTKGREVICVGSSAGGYAATLLGCLLNASHVFNFSGQYSLLHLLENEDDRALNPTLIRYEHTGKYRKYFSIYDLVTSAGTPVFYFFPAKCNEDVVQSKLVDAAESVYKFKFDCDSHGSTCLYENYRYLFAKSKEELKKLHEECDGAVLSPLEFSVKACGYARTWKFRMASRGAAVKRHFRRT